MPDAAPDICVYEAHSWDTETLLRIETGGGARTVRIVRDNAIRSEPCGLALIVDDLCETRLPYFFPRSRRVALLKETPRHTRTFDTARLRSVFDLVLTHRADLIELGPPFVRVDFSSNWVRDGTADALSRKSRLVSFIGSLAHPDEDGYVLRRSVAGMLSRMDVVDCFGRGVREIASKRDALQDYCFSVAMENIRENYYYTEKLIDCILCETVPIYWGCPDIGSILDARGMLTFEDESDLMEVVKGLSFARYERMRPYLMENIRICEERRLDSYRGYLSRCIDAIDASGFTLVPTLAPWRKTKAMAGARLAGERILHRGARRTSAASS